MANQKHKTYFWRILTSVDQLFNTLIGGDEDETISSRLGKALQDRTGCWICCVLCNMLNWIDPNHCRDAIERDEGLHKEK